MRCTVKHSKTYKTKFRLLNWYYNVYLQTSDRSMEDHGGGEIESEFGKLHGQQLA